MGRPMAGRHPRGTAITVVRPTIKTKGIFSEDGEAKVWLSDDAYRYPVQLKSKFSKFSITLSLESVKPGDATAQGAMLAALGVQEPPR